MHSRAVILVPGRLNPHAHARVRDAFDCIDTARADTALLTDEMRARVQGIAAMTRIDAAFIDALPHLRIIANFGVGYDAVDAAHAASKGIVVTHTPDVLNDEVADTAIGLLLNTLRELPKAEAWLRAGRWAAEGPYRLTPLSLRRRSIGILGMGRIGKAIARRLEGFCVPIAYHNRRPDPALAYPYHDSIVDLAGAVDTLISVLPATAETLRICDRAVFEALGPRGVFINVGRGSTVNEADLALSLADGTIAAAGLDVFEDEPHVPRALLDLPNACLLPHVASASIDTRTAMGDLVADNLTRYFTDGRVLTPVPECQHFALRA
ncbi:MAG: 2-hydroxyacid dehydrogenase [Rhizobiaceae bacterium]|jgi:lactate dehydrogenase-like 2-hydroxyacid dehydrogenase|nr:2-hydroxyacid dehydrogenase [Rhizobiaceae bacterium]